MSQHIENADGQGTLVIGHGRSPVTYQISAVRSGEQYTATTTLQAPRDWLLKQGFRQEALLERDGAEVIKLYRPERLDVGDDVSVSLSSEPLTCKTREELVDRFPELDLVRMHRL
ncbi:hypothetical protein [Ciceribacter ferrooxidans]|uniref:Uncharacterized protein n=1 Tax=Ciceribacter ferrooxidans TaxID=2509717 RepID=A0A4Q2SKI5_9HYPH|nr:hypothetical protein [Ciceribacter ferrooxidans]RYC04554.1 hypothetical protein EUU22_20540 [Ciceribacter ferrooxidans]